jgi:hypothetical protein
MTGAELAPVAQQRLSLSEQREYARLLATAGLLPKQYRDRPGDILLALAYADSLNLPVAQIFVGLHVIEGVPSMSAELMQALIRRAGHKIRTEATRGPLTEAEATCTITRRDDPEPFAETFTMADAVQAKLVTIQPDGTLRSRTKNGEPTPWELYPRAMLKARATSAAARAHCADVLAGVSYTPEEIDRRPSVMPFIDADPEPQLGTREVIEAEARVREHHGQAPVDGPAGSGGGATEPAEGDHTGEQQSGPQNRSEGLESGAEPAPEAADPPPDPEAEWRANWHDRLDAAVRSEALVMIVDLGNEAAKANAPELVEVARARYNTLARPDL